jgi:hypothetical protein
MKKKITFVFDDRSLASLYESADAYHIRMLNEQELSLPKEFFAIESFPTMDRTDATLGIWLHCMTCGDWHYERESCIRPNRSRRSS